MNVIVLNGSPRKNGATSKILNKMVSVLKEKTNVNVELIHISDIDLQYCKGCCSCFTKGSCFIKDDAEELSKKIREADGLIIGSPTYASNVSGQLKVLIDRGHFVIEQLLYGKYAISVTTYENYGAYGASKTLNNILSYSGAQISGKITLKLPFSSDPLSNTKLEKLLLKKSQKLYKDITKNQIYILQKIKHFIILNIGIKPFVKKKGELYKGVLDKWTSIGINTIL